MQTKSAKVQLKDEAGKVLAEKEFTAVRFEVDDAVLKGKAKEEVLPLIGTAFNEMVDFLSKEDSESNPLQRVMTYVSRAFDLERRAGIRQSLVAQVEGPGVAIDKAATAMVKAMAAMGITLSMDTARETIRKQAEASKAA